MYITAEKLNQLYPDETTDLTEEIINLAISAGEQEVNSYLAAKFVVPFALPLPALLEDIVVVCVRYRLPAQGRPYNKDLSDDLSKRYAKAIEMLKSIVKGELNLLGENVVPAGSHEAVMISTPPRRWEAF